MRQRVSGFVLVYRPNSSPIKFFEQRQSGRVKRDIRRYYPEEIWEILFGKHRMRVRVG